MQEYIEDQLKEIIENTFGFNKDLIENPVQTGLWHVRFEVNGIKYYGWIAHSGALPEIKVEGYTAKHYDFFGTPITEDYYNKFEKGEYIL